VSNGRTVSINYTPRMKPFEAYDKLPPKIKRALQSALISYDAYGVYRYWQKIGNQDAVVRWIASGDTAELKRPWWRGMPCPTHTLRLKPLKDRSYRP
jgi:hypothetical protein